MHPLCPLPVRYTLVGLLTFGAFVLSMNRVSLSTAILALAPAHSNHSAGGEALKGHCDPPLPSEPPTQPTSHLSQNESSPGPVAPEFAWSDQQQSVLLGAYYVGNMFLLVPSGLLAEAYGGKVVAGAGATLAVLLNLLSPLAARCHYGAFFAVRVALGASGAALLTSFFNVMSRWVPDAFRSRTVALISVGSSLGSITITVLSGYVCQYGWLGGWPSLFYFVSAVASLWLLLWTLASSTHPAGHPFIRRSEVVYIENSIKHRGSQSPAPKAPWVAILSSKAVLATIFVKIAHSWFYSLFSLKITTYIIAVLAQSLEQSSMDKTLFHLVMLISILASGFLSDLVIARQCCSRTVVRKMFECMSTFVCALFVFLLAYTNCSHAWFVGAMVMALASHEMNTGGSGTIIMDQTADYAATLVAITSTISMFVGFATPSMVSWIQTLSGTNLQAQWNNVFYFTSAFLVTGGVVFAVFGSAEHQNWERVHAGKDGPLVPLEQRVNLARVGEYVSGNKV